MARVVRSLSVAPTLDIFETCWWCEKLKILKLDLPGESSDTGVLDGVGLCPGGRKCEGDPLLEPPPVAEIREAWGRFEIKIVRRKTLPKIYLHEDFDVKDYGHLDLVRRVAFRQHLALVLLSSSSCTWNVDFETKFSPINRDRWIKS